MLDGEGIEQRRFDGGTMRRSESGPGVSRLFWVIAVTAALAALLAPAASAAPGDQLWTKSWPTPGIPGYEIRTDPQLVRGPGGDYWVAATGMNGSTRDRNYVILRYAPTGVLRWALETGSPNSGHEYASDLAVGRDGSAFVTGDMVTPADAIWTIKVSPAGKRVWARKLVSAAHGGNVVSAVACDSSGNAYVLGTKDRTGRGRELVLFSYSPRGKLRWTRYLSAPGGGDDIAVDIVIGSRNRIFVTGTLQSLHKGTDILVARFTTAGAAAWKRVWDGGAGKDDVAHALAVSAAGVVVAGATTPATGEAQGVVLRARVSMSRSAKLRARRSVVPGLDLGWGSVAIDAAGGVAVAGTAYGASVQQFAYAEWRADGSAVVFAHVAPLDGDAWGTEARLWNAGALIVAGSYSSGANRGINIRSLGPAPHEWVRSTTDDGLCSGLAVSADGVCVAGPLGTGGFPAQIGLWMYEP